MKLVQLILLSTFLTFAGAAEAAEQKRIFARKAIGEIHRMDMTERTAVISGFRYYFGSVTTGDASEVSMLGFNAGSFEMLEPGMKVFLLYAEYGNGRYVIRAEQLPQSTNLYDRETRNQLLN